MANGSMGDYRHPTGGSMGTYPHGKTAKQKAKQKGAAIQPEHVPGVRKVLRAHGYKVAATGPLTDRLLSAWRNYRRGIHYGYGAGRGTGDNAQPGAKTPHEWNQHNPANPRDLSGERLKVENSPPAAKHIVHPVENVKAKAKLHDKAAAHAQALGSGKQHKVGGAALPGVSSGGPNVNKLLPSGLADTLAGQVYDPQIREARLQQLRDQADTNQSLKDIGSWYAQVGKSQETARTRDVAAGAAAKGDVAQALQGVMQMLGGSRGAGVVGASGAADLTAVAQGAQAQDQYNNDLAPIFALEKASAGARQKALASQSAEKLSSQLVDLQGARGQARSKALMDIIGANNQARQQNFGNRLALNNAALAAESMGLDVAKVNAQLRQYGLQNKMANAELKMKQQAAKVASGHPNWQQLDAPAKENYTAHAVQQAIADLYGAQPTKIDPAAVANRARARLRALGYGSARDMRYKGRVPSRAAQASILGLLQGAIQQATSKYNARQ